MKKTISEWLKDHEIEMDKNEVIWLSTKVAQDFRKLYPDEPLKKVYRRNGKGKKGKPKSIAIGYGYDERAIEIMSNYIHM